MKPWWKSQTIQVTALMIVIDVLALWLSETWLSPKTVIVLGLIHSHAVLLLRWKTTQRITSFSQRFDDLQEKAIKKFP